MTETELRDAGLKREGRVEPRKPRQLEQQHRAASSRGEVGGLRVSALCASCTPAGSAAVPGVWAAPGRGGGPAAEARAAGGGYRRPE